MAERAALCDVRKAMEFAHSRAISHRHPAQDRQRAAERVRAEYREMPGLSLSLAQAVRLLGLDRPICGEVFRTLVHDGFLRETPRGHYVLAE
jgi:hypothetical protein